MLTLRRLSVLEVRIPFRFTFRHALAARSEGHGILVRAESADGAAGFGECVPRSYVTGETPESVVAALSGDLGRPWPGASFRTFEEAVAALRGAAEHLPRDRHAAFCALELAVLDVAGRTFGRSAGDVAGPPAAASAHYSGVVSADTLESSLKALEAIKGFGLSEVKLKVGMSPEADIELLRRARDVLGESCGLRIDANCAWSAEEAQRRLDAFAPFRLQAVEQPLPGDDLEGLAWLTARSPVPVIVDESLASAADARALIGMRACHHFNIRVSKCGGLINAARLRDLGAAAGIGCQVGAQVGETVLLSAAGRHLATRTPGVLFCEGSYGRMLLESDIGVQDLTIPPGGRAPALDGAGLGVDVDPAKLAPFIVNRLDLGGR